jgi:MFS family permease
VQMRGASWRLHVPSDSRLRRVLIAYGLNGLIEFATWLAILLVAYNQGGPFLAGVASFSMLLPAMTLVPLLATFGDRVPRGRALSLTYACVAVSSLATGILLWIQAPLWAVLIGGAALAVALGLVRPMHFAAMPLIARRPGDLVAANGLSSALDGVAVFAGFVLAGVVTEQVGAWVVLVAASGLGVLAALLTRGLGIPRLVVVDGDSPREIREAFRGFAALRGNWGALSLLGLLAVTSVVEGSNDVLTVTFNDQVLGRDASTAGLIAGSYGVGLALGGATLAGLAHRRWVAPIVLSGALLLGFSEAAVGFVSSLGPAVVLLALVGFGVSMVLVSARTLLQRGTDSEVLARVLAIQEGVYLTGLTAGAVIAPLLIAALGPARAFLPLGVSIAAMGLLSFRAIRRLDRQAPSHRREVSLLSQVPFLAALPPYELERLAEGARWRDVRAGVPVVTQGEYGDAYFLVSRGQLSVTVDGERREHTLTAGEGFGEIALLRSVPRTATVTALIECELLEVGAKAFLGAVTSDLDGSGMAQLAVQERLAGDRAGQEQRVQDRPAD